MDAALACFRKLIELDPQNAWAHRNLGVALGHKGQVDTALASYHKALELDPKNTLILLDVAALQAWYGQDKELADTGRRALAWAKDTTVPDAAERTAKVCCLLPSTDQAQLEAVLALARKAVDLGKGNPYLPFYQMTLGMAEYRNGQFAEAYATLLAASRLKSDIPVVQYYVPGTSAFYRAMSLFRQGKVAEAPPAGPRGHGENEAAAHRREQPAGWRFQPQRPDPVAGLQGSEGAAQLDAGAPAPGRPPG